MTDTTDKSHAEIDESITDSREMTALEAAIRTQPFWVFIAIVVMCIVMSFVSDVFMTERNIFNVTRNFAFFGIMALGMSAVICTGGIDLSVGSLMGLAGIAGGLVMQAGYGIEFGFLAVMATSLIVGAINGVLSIGQMCAYCVKIGGGLKASVICASMMKSSMCFHIDAATLPSRICERFMGVVRSSSKVLLVISDCMAVADSIATESSI